MEMKGRRGLKGMRREVRATRIPWTGMSLAVLLLLGAAACGGRDAGGHGEEGHGHGEGELTEVALTQAQMQTVGIEIGNIERRELAGTLTAPGALEVGAGSEGVASPRLAGTVTRICVEPGQRVAAGQPVAYVDCPELLALHEEEGIAAEEVAAARRELERQEALAAQGAGVRRNLEAARGALSVASIRLQGVKARLSACGDPKGSVMAVASPLPGVVVGVETPVGAFADMQSPVVRVVDTSRMYCMVRIPEKDAGAVAPGMGVEMRLTGSPATVFGGRVTEIAPVLDAQSRTVGVKVELDRAGAGSGRLLPGMAVTAMLSGAGEEVDALPEQAVVSAGGRSYIFVLEEEHDGECHFEKREVVPGKTAFGYVGVTPVEPLAPDARVVVKGAFYLNSMTTDHGEHDH